jgi:hypothetical protein
LIDRGDVGMTQRGQDFGFTLKANEAIGIAGDGRRQHFYRHGPLQIRVGRAIDLAHTADADLGGHFIAAEASTGLQGHDRARLYAAETL